MKTPKQVRDDIRTLTVHLSQVREALVKRSGTNIAQIGKECRRTADALGELLKTQELPEDYKVAVVGRFKTGKSSFVNELLGARLASEDTNPETAAITSFRHGAQVKATVRFVPQQEWVKLQALHAEDVKHVDAHRVKIWNTFAKPKKNKDGEAEEAFDLPVLERLYVKPGGHQIEIPLTPDGTKKSENEFRRRLKEFTSGAKPLHCLVQAIEITSPAPILDEGVLLIDTPGLDDTERFRVANRIFPKVQEMLSDYTSLFAVFAKDFEVYLNVLSQEGAKISDSLELGSTMPFDVTVKLKESLERSLQSAQELITAEELRVTSMLDDFVSDEVSERITERRTKVSSIWGAGTTNSQSAEVRDFYREVKALLSEALNAHLKTRSEEFGQFLVVEAEGAPRDALNEVQVLFEQAADNIRAAAAAVVAGQKEAVQSLVDAIGVECAESLRRADELMTFGSTPVDESSKLGVLLGGNTDPRPSAPQLPTEPSSTLPPASPELSANRPSTVQTHAALQDDADWVSQTQQMATVVMDRIRLQDGAAGWPYSKVFDARLLKGAVRMTLIDPYLASHHQIRNLNEFLLHVAETARPKAIDIVTRFEPLDTVGHQDRAVDNTAKDLFQNFGVALTLRREANLHDRYLVLDHGVLFKLGRGLDIYKPATGLAAHRPASRRVRETEVDVFAVPGHPAIQGPTT